MGYATIQQVQRIDEADHYAQAHRIWDTTKPIRGNPDRNARPLGARRDAREYYCTKDSLTGNITYHYYGKPTLSFAPNGDVVLCAHKGYAGHNQLITRVLGIPAYIKNGSVILELGGVKKVMDSKAGMRLVKGEDGNWQTTDAPKLYGYKINRKKMTEAKAEYKEFERFFKGFLAVQKMDRPIVHKYETSFKCIPIHVSTMVELFGAVKDSHQRSYVNITKYREMVDKPYVHTRYVATHAGLHYFNASGAVAELITSNQSEDTKQANFLKGAYLFCYRAASYGFYMETDDGTKYAHLNKTLKIYEDFILLKHTDSVTDLVELPDGTLPNPKLAKAMTWHEQSDECEKLRKARETQTEYDPTQTEYDPTQNQD
jgi:hypothetical protein